MDGPDCLIRRHPQTRTIFRRNRTKFRSQPPDARYQLPVSSRGTAAYHRGWEMKGGRIGGIYAHRQGREVGSQVHVSQKIKLFNF